MKLSLSLIVIILLTIEGSIAEFDKCNTCQSIIQTRKRSEIIKKQGKHILSQVHLQPADPIAFK